MKINLPAKTIDFANYSQKEAYTDLLGDEWYEANKTDFGKKPDPVQAIIESSGIRPKTIVEVGCANGWRLRRLWEKYGCEIAGIEPSAKAVKEGNETWANGALFEGTADKLPFRDGSVDLLIYAYCLVWCDPSDLFKIVAEGHRVLANGGGLVIWDRQDVWPVRYPCAVLGSKQDAGNGPLTYTTYFYVMDHTKLWLAHPSYKKIGDLFERKNGHAEITTMLRRDDKTGWVEAELDNNAKYRFADFEAA